MSWGSWLAAVVVVVVVVPAVVVAVVAVAVAAGSVACCTGSGCYSGWTSFGLKYKNNQTIQ